MKFHWFHLMPYSDLPDDFRQKHRSVWVDVDPQAVRPGQGPPMYHDYLDELEYADQLGFDGICSTSTTRTPMASCRRPTSWPPRSPAAPSKPSSS